MVAVADRPAVSVVVDGAGGADALDRVRHRTHYTVSRRLYDSGEPGRMVLGTAARSGVGDRHAARTHLVPDSPVERTAHAHAHGSDGRPRDSDHSGRAL